MENVEDTLDQLREFANSIFGNTDLSVMQIKEMLKELQDGLDDISGDIDILMDNLD